MGKKHGNSTRDYVKSPHTQKSRQHYFLHYYLHYSFLNLRIFMKQLFTLRARRNFLCNLMSILFIGLLFPVYLSAEVVDKVVAVVNNEVITLSELEEETSGLLRSITENNPQKPILEALEEARQVALNGMIERRLIQQKAKKYNVTVTEEDIDIAYENIRNGMSLDPAEFIEKLGKSGLTVESYRDKLKSQILQSRLLSYDVRSKIVVTEEMIVDYYRENYTSKVDQGSYYLLQIGCSWSETDDPEELRLDKQQTRLRTERIYELAQKGQDFRVLAEKFSELPSASDGGDIGVFTLDEMAPAMRDAVSSLQPGEVSKIIETPAGYQFFKLLSGEENATVVTAAFEAVKEVIREKIYEEKLKAAYAEWVKKLKEDAYIQRL
jgi:peptidyl-prolyl cis-trans isomerase SurA